MEPEPEQIPPRPILGDSVREEARERERRAAKKLFFSLPFIKSPPPIPAPNLDTRNPWQLTVEAIPVDATVVKPVHPIRTVRGAKVAGRSRFRKGTMTLDPDGFTLTGVGVTPITWLRVLGFACYCLSGLIFFLLPNSSGNPAGNNVMIWIAGVSFCAGVLAYTLENVITEMWRGPQEIRVFWDNVLEAQFEEKMRWAVILYRAPEPKPGVPGPVAHLPINNLTPTLAAALWDAFDAYAPGRTRPDSGMYRWTTGRKFIAMLLFGTIMTCAVIILRVLISP